MIGGGTGIEEEEEEEEVGEEEEDEEEEEEEGECGVTQDLSLSPDPHEGRVSSEKAQNQIPHQEVAESSEEHAEALSVESAPPEMK